MNDPKNLFIRDFTYDLPESKIAKYPLADRDSSRLLIFKNGNIAEDIYRNIADHIPKKSLLIFNNTKVVEARLLFQKSTGGIIEIFCLEPDEQYADITTGLAQYERVRWHCLIGGASKWKHGQLLTKKIAHPEKEFTLTANYIEKQSDNFIIELSWNNALLSFAEVLHYAGSIPLPPYIKREADGNDSERYQTVYALAEGSVAAPTAGLHFTQTIFDSLAKKNIEKDFVTLHVGAGTFKPVKSDTLAEHDMHSEFINVSKKTIQHVLSNLNQTIISVGTTSFRTIESLYWLGVKKSLGELRQWDPYELPATLSAQQALESVLEQMDKKGMERLITRTQILAAPPYKTKIVNALVTNFHQPQSTLLLLVASLIGDDWKKVYNYALQNNFRFLSYGDGCLLWANL